MTRQQVMALARKKFGKKARLEERDAPDRDTREILRKELEKLRANEPKAPPPTPEQEQYRKDWNKWKEEKSILQSRLLRHRWQVGYISDLGGFAMFHIEGQGDTLDEVCQKAKLIKPTE